MGLFSFIKDAGDIDPTDPVKAVEAYDRKQMNNAYMAGWMRERRKAKKGARHGT